MQVARRVPCYNALRRQTTALVFGRTWTSPYTCRDSARHYSVKASQTTPGHDRDSRTETKVATPETQSLRSAPPRSHAAATTPTLRYIPLAVQNSGEQIFEFRDARQRKVDRSRVVRPQAETISRDHAAGLSRILENGRGADYNPVALFGILAGWILRHEARNLGYRIAPDGFTRLSDLVRVRFDVQVNRTMV